MESCEESLDKTATDSFILKTPYHSLLSFVQLYRNVIWDKEVFWHFKE